MAYGMQKDIVHRLLSMLKTKLIFRNKNSRKNVREKYVKICFIAVAVSRRNTGKITRYNIL